MVNKTKAQFRKEAIQRREALTEAERKRGSLLMTEAVLGHQWFYRAQNVLLFVSYGSEIDTTELLQEALRMKKKVYVPKVCGEDMEFYRIDDMDGLAEGYKGILEPININPDRRYIEGERMVNGETVLMIMPGACFDKTRNRIGYGKGFYDKYLSDKPDLLTYTIAVGFLCQEFEELPTTENDIKPYQVILK